MCLHAERLQTPRKDRRGKSWALTESTGAEACQTSAQSHATRRRPDSKTVNSCTRSARGAQASRRHSKPNSHRCTKASAACSYVLREARGTPNTRASRSARVKALTHLMLSAGSSNGTGRPGHTGISTVCAV